ncbi:MAG TPA: CDP-alcohol phosphatidyltransferase family protein [Candidatus Thermoplasmatota archaeon]|nr:CDP-alcohol phosphatidyltransferase family protein [Candidatus Thermoplasmatota archaeon]
MKLRLRRREEEAYDRPFERAAAWLLQRGVHPNHLTVLQLPVFLLQISAALEGWTWVFVLCIFPLMLLDGGDGVLARVGGLQSRSGAVLDSIFDLMGIAIVLWGAAQFFPRETPWFMAFFFGNFLLFLQNALLGEKVIAYLRGPILVAVAFPATLAGALAVDGVVLVWLLATRMPRSVRALAASPA